MILTGFIQWMTSTFFLILLYRFDMANTNVNDPNFEKLKHDSIPDVILVKKYYPEQKQKRRWKLRHFLDKMDTDSVNK